MRATFNISKRDPPACTCASANVSIEHIARLAHSCECGAVERVFVGPLENGAHFVACARLGDVDTFKRPARSEIAHDTSEETRHRSFEVVEHREAGEPRALERVCFECFFRWNQCLREIDLAAYRCNGVRDEFSEVLRLLNARGRRNRDHRGASGRGNCECSAAERALWVARTEEIAQVYPRASCMCEEALASGWTAVDEKPRSVRESVGGAWEKVRRSHWAVDGQASLGSCTIGFMRLRGTKVVFFSTLSLSASLLFVTTLSVLSGIAESTQAVASPLAAPPKKDLTLTPNAMRMYKDPSSGQMYAYITFDLLNSTGSDRRFAPRFELLTDEGVVIESGNAVPSKVTRAIKTALGDPLMEDQFELLGSVLEGKENGRRGLIIWHMKETAPTEITVFITGLSRVSDKNPHPTSGEPLVRRKTMQVEYLVPGDAIPHTTVSYEPEKIDWIMR